MTEWTGNKLKALGASVEYVDVGMQTLPDGSQLKLPPVLLGELGHDPKKKTVLLYGHLDVQPAAKEDGWDYDPFVVSLHKILFPSPSRGRGKKGHWQLSPRLAADHHGRQIVRAWLDRRQRPRHRVDPRPRSFQSVSA